MRHFFKTKKNMNSAMEILFANNWILPDNFLTENPEEVEITNKKIEDTLKKYNLTEDMLNSE